MFENPDTVLPQEQICLHPVPAIARVGIQMPFAARVFFHLVSNGLPGICAGCINSNGKDAKHGAGNSSAGSHWHEAARHAGGASIGGDPFAEDRIAKGGIVPGVPGIR
jgi:hypothetical protein